MEDTLAVVIAGLATSLAALAGRQAARERQAARRATIAPGERPPIFRDAAVFARCCDPGQQQRLIGMIEAACRRGALRLSSSQQVQAAGSPWMLDRIGLYLYEEAANIRNPAARLLHLRHELEQLKETAAPRTLLALRYAARSLLTLARRHPELLPRLRDADALLHEVIALTQRHAQLPWARATRCDVARLLILVHRQAGRD
ncbi:hypothetical protein [Kallotenue papyrolyticum]|uniref:hypothetical protein n=1 Tax=Kallotenue papyrolyticum TaxID=1325125 RepID=UPI0004786081|nr:hypothetical protein [Kallotenue papyrolyticum]